MTPLKEMKDGNFKRRIEQEIRDVANEIESGVGSYYDKGWLNYIIEKVMKKRGILPKKPNTVYEYPTPKLHA